MAEDIVDAHTVDTQIIDEGLHGFTGTSCLKNTCHAEVSRLSRTLQKERPPGRAVASVEGHKWAKRGATWIWG